jgi:FkbM family methyltransferase
MDQIQGLFFRPPLDSNCWGHIFEEIYKTGLFNPVIPEKKEGTVVIDAGANLGLASYYFSSRFEKVLSIEPSSRHFEVLNYMLDYNKITNVKPFQFALSNKDGESEFYQYTNRTMDSLYGNLENANLKITGKETVPLKRLDTFMKEQNIEHVDLLKLDVEGVEYEILCGDSFANVASKIDIVVCEIHSYSGRNPNQITDALKMNGYEVQLVPHDATLIIARRKKV